ncbi:hypothetical protein ABZ078_13885 [Streptomyces sp. NPDC006385]|uniref:hypothetical protein n=1 Tax=Streptomyces sp. NPDC006385 TaxID=3156761 RepID=UPI0033BEFCEA
MPQTMGRYLWNDFRPAPPAAPRDVRPDELTAPGDAAKFAVTAAACRSVGWDFARFGTPDAVLMANVRWLAGCRHPRVHRPDVADRLVEVFADGAGLLDGARTAAQIEYRLGNPEGVATLIASNATAPAGPAPQVDEPLPMGARDTSRH